VPSKERGYQKIVEIMTWLFAFSIE
jgi:hypothetical protein